MPFKIERLSIQDIILIRSTAYQDERGFFMETYKYSEYSTFGVKDRFVQDNYSRSIYGVIRGLHYQKRPRAQGKLIQVNQGEIFDVSVDIRKGSPTFGRWVGIGLSAEDRQLLYVPVGFAHGFCVISQTAEVLYKVTEEYSPFHEDGIVWDDPDIAIDWPVKNPILSKKDKAHPCLKNIDTGFVFEEDIG